MLSNRGHEIAILCFCKRFMNIYILLLHFKWILKVAKGIVPITDFHVLQTSWEIFYLQAARSHHS